MICAFPVRDPYPRDTSHLVEHGQRAMTAASLLARSGQLSVAVVTDAHSEIRRVLSVT